MSCNENTLIKESLYDDVLEMSFTDMMSVANPKSTDEITDTLDMGMVKFALGGVGNYNKLVYDVTEHTMRALPVKHFEEFLTLGVKNYELKDKMLNRFHQLISLAVENMFENLGDPDDSHAHNERLREIERGQ